MLTKTEYTGTLEEAVFWTFQQGRSGDVILLSSACSSFDMFRMPIGGMFFSKRSGNWGN